MLGRLSRLLGRGEPAARPWEGPYDPRATTDDILACFRLLLGRRPNPEEWQGHSSRAGEELPGVVASYLGSLEFARRGLLPAAEVPELAEGPGFRIYAAGVNEREPDMTAFLRRVLRPGMGVLDIGAGTGWFSLLSASVVGPGGLVVAVEPDAAKARMAEASRRANGFENVLVVQAAVGVRTGLLGLKRAQSGGTVSPLPDDLGALLDADSVACLPLGAVLPVGRQFGLVRVCAGECLALQACEEMLARDRPVIIERIAGSQEEHLRWLRGLGYSLHVVQPGGEPGPEADVEDVLADSPASDGDRIDLAAFPRA